VIQSYANGKTEDTGPLTKKRMETVDEEFLAAALDFIDRQITASKRMSPTIGPVWIADPNHRKLYPSY